jgi:hypothetical protein
MASANRIAIPQPGRWSGCEIFDLGSSRGLRPRQPLRVLPARLRRGGNRCPAQVG